MLATASCNEVARFHLNVGDVLITKDSEDATDIAVPAIVEATAPDLLCGYHLAIIRPGPETDGLFLKYLFDQPRLRAYFASRANGATRFGLTVSSITNAAIPVPPLPSQRTIAAILRTWDLGIARLQALEDARRRLKQGLMNQLIPGAFHFHKSRQRAGRAVKLRDLGYCYSGLSGKTKNDFSDTGCAFVPYINIFNNTEVDPSHLGRVRIAPDERQNLVRNGDILFTASSETPSEVGITSAFLCEKGSPCYLNSFCYGFRLNDVDAVLPKFASYYFRTQQGRRTMNRIAQGATRYNLSVKHLLDVVLHVPAAREQRRIVETLDTCDEAMKAVRALGTAMVREKRWMADVLFGDAQGSLSGIAR